MSLHVGCRNQPYERNPRPSGCIDTLCRGLCKMNPGEFCTARTAAASCDITQIWTSVATLFAFSQGQQLDIICMHRWSGRAWTWWFLPAELQSPHSCQHFRCGKVWSIIAAINARQLRFGFDGTLSCSTVFQLCIRSKFNRHFWLDNVTPLDNEYDFICTVVIISVFYGCKKCIFWQAHDLDMPGQLREWT